MNNEKWKEFFLICAACLGKGNQLASVSESWCAWTTFRQISENFAYWTSGIPGVADIRETYISEGGSWAQPFSYSELAHIVIPRTFYWEAHLEGGFQNGSRVQDIHKLSLQLATAKIDHRITDLVLEIKLY